MIQSNHWLQEEYIIDTPENVSFGFEVAGIGSRFIGALIDGFVLALALLVLNLVVGFVLELVDGAPFADAFGDGDVSWSAGLIMAAYALLNFLLIAGYYMIFELIWNGQTVGKRVAKIRVVRVNGSPAGFLEIVVRNLVRMVDFLPMAYGVGLITMFFNRHARRLGDFAAGTMVIKEQTAVSLDTLGAATTAAQPPTDAEIERWRARFPALRRMTVGDYTLIRETLRRHDQGQVQTAMLFQLAAAIARRVDTLPPARDWQSSRRFLYDVAEAYRNLIE